MSLKRKRVPFTALVVLIVVAVLFCGSFTSQAEEQGALLREIEDYIERYYLYAPEDEFRPLNSLGELERILIDPYSTYLPEEQFQSFDEGLGRSFQGVGVYLELREEEVTVVSALPGSPAWRAGIKSGDVIIAADRHLVKGLSLEEVTARISGEAGTEVSLTIWRDGELITFELTRERIRLPLAEYAWLEEGIAWMSIYGFGQGAKEEVGELLQELEEGGLKGLILDLRANSGGYVEEVLEVAALFTEGTLLQVKERRGSSREIGAGPRATLTYPLVLLCSEGTASAAELMASALKDNGAAVLAGEPTFGKGTIQTLFPLEGSGYLKLTTAEFISPRGNVIEGAGVEPHFLVSGEEGQVEIALELLRYETGLKNGSSFMGAVLQEKRAEDGSTPVPLEHEGRLYYPLRASLLSAGRAIHQGNEPWLYYFTWEGRRYELDLRTRFISWEEAEGEKRQSSFLLQEGTSYVERDFWREILGMAFF